MNSKLTTALHRVIVCQGKGANLDKGSVTKEDNEQTQVIVKLDTHNNRRVQVKEIEHK